MTLVGGIACLVFACLASQWRKRGVLIAAALILLAPSGLALIIVKPELINARVREFKRLHRDITIGMHRSEVMTVIEKHYPPKGTRPTPRIVENSDTRLGFLMDQEKPSDPNCEGIFLQMQDGKVVAKSYSAD